MLSDPSLPGVPLTKSEGGSPADRPTVLVVHPDGGTRSFLLRVLSAFGYAALSATRGEEAVELVASGEVPVVLLALDLPGMSGLDTLRTLRALRPPPEVLVTGPRSVEVVADVTRGGAFEFFPEPIDVTGLNEILRAAHAQALPRRHVPPGALEGRDPIPDIVGQSPGIRQVLALIQRAAPTHFPVLIHGESGTGKELVARATHARSPRATMPLTVVNCGALQDTLLESELFGHERGAFTGAHVLKHGLFETANQGTVFLDEIGEMSPVMQVKVLRALESGEVRRVGATRLIRADIRIIAATNRDLREEVKRGRFREDLYYRLAVIEIRVPPLRERPDDVPLLVAHFLRTNAAGGRPRLQIAADAMECLKAYPWPGNIRELRNCIERLSVFVDADVVTVDALPPTITAKTTPASGVPDASGDLTLAEVERLHILR
ncbi:MAG: sigma-54-dependent transcriptional regulator, partial [Candidatus Rokuibacteriota bacterium]